MPVRSALAAKYPKLQRISGQLKNRIEMINARMEEKKELEKELTETKGIFKGSRREELQKQINDAGQQIVRRQLNIAPTLTIRPGFPVRVIVTRDLVLESYGGS